MKKNVSMLIVAMTMAAPEVWAMPDPTVDLSPITKKVSLDGIGQIYGDDLNHKIIYVAPSSLKVNGQFYQTSSGISCENLYHFRNALYKMPLEQDLDQIYKEDQFVSPLFEVSMASLHRQQKLVNKINDLREEALEKRKDSQDLYEEYSAAYQQKEAIKAEYEQWKDQLTTVHQKMVTELTLAANETERAAIRASYAKDFAEINSNISQLTKSLSVANQRFVIATKSWAPIRDELQFIKELEDDMTASLENLTKNSKELYENGKSQLDILSKKIIGKATAGYSLDSNSQVAILAKRIADAGLDYDVRHLEVMNAKLNPSITKISAEISTQGADKFQMNTYEINPTTQIPLGTEMKRMTLPGKIEIDGETKDLEFNTLVLSSNSGASQNFEMPVTIAGYCGNPKLEKREYTSTGLNGESIKSVAIIPVFNKDPSKVLFAENVSINYNYYQKVPPVKGFCAIDVEQSANYMRDTGKKKYGGFFNRKTKSWDNTRIEYDKNMGLACSINRVPMGSSEEESQEMNDALQKALYQDVFHMFIMAYAKEYKVVETPRAELGEDSRFFSQIGSGVMNLCGKNKFCEFGSVVLKSMDELVGSRHTGSSSHTQKLTGKIRKDFTLNTYRISEGSANVEMKVCVDRKSCEENL